MGRRKLLILILIIACLFSYIAITTLFVNEPRYRELAWELIGHDKHVMEWEHARVDVVKLSESSCRTAPLLSAKINRFLLALNGGYAVRVEFSTDQDGLLGPIVLYFNPFTKKCIGGDLRM